MADTKSNFIIVVLFAIVTFNGRPSTAYCTCTPLGNYYKSRRTADNPLANYGTRYLGFYNCNIGTACPFYYENYAFIATPFIPFYGYPPTTHKGPAACLYAVATCNISCTGLNITRVNVGTYSINGFSNEFEGLFRNYITPAGVIYIDITAATIIDATYMGMGIFHNGSVHHTYTYVDYGFSNISDCMSCCNKCCPGRNSNGGTSVGPYLSLSCLTLFYIALLAFNDFFDKIA